MDVICAGDKMNTSIISKPRVNIIMSTCNGEKYIEEQLQSIYGQTYQNWKLFVRDDGSSDRTLEVLRQHEKKGKLTLYNGSNMGFVKSFFWLLKNSPEADYYSFADQDDLWLDFKIERAVNFLERGGRGRPLLYFSDFDYCDADLNFIKCRSTRNNELSFVEAMADGNRTIGFSCVISKEFKDYLLRSDPTNLFAHDHFMYLLSFVVGTPVYDRVTTVKYRRHGCNTSMARSEYAQLMMWRIKNFLLKENDRFRKMYTELLFNYRDILDDEKKKLLASFIYDYNSFKNRFYKTFYPKRFRQYLVDEVALRMLFLLGRM